MLNDRLKIRILKKYGTQADFADLVGERDSYVSMIVRGRRSLPDEKKSMWAKALGCKQEELFEA